MELFLKPSMLYTFIVLIPWSCVYIPGCLRKKRFYQLYPSVLAQLFIYGYLFKVSNPDENWPYVIFAATGLITFFTAGGFLQHWANMKYHSE